MCGEGCGKRDGVGGWDRVDLREEGLLPTVSLLERKHIRDLVVAMRIRVLLLVRPRDEQEEADESSRDTTQRGTVSTTGGVGAGVCGAFAQSQQRAVAEASAEDRESPPSVDRPSGRTPVGAGGSGDAGDGATVAGEPGSGGVGIEDGG